MPRTYLKSTGSSAEFKDNNSAKSSVFDSLAIKPGKKKKKGKENRLFDDSDDSFNSNNEKSLKSAATSKLSDDETNSMLQNTDKDDTFDKLFANVNKNKIRVLSVPFDSSSELNPQEEKEEEESNDGNCWGLFKSFSEKDHPEGKQIQDSTKQTIPNPKVPDFIVNPVPDVMDYPTVDHHVPEISSLAHLPATTNPHSLPDVFESPFPGSQDRAQRSYLPKNLPSPSIIVLDDDSIHTNPALNSYKKKIFSPATFFSQTPGASKSKKTVSCLTSTPVLSVSRYSVTTPQSEHQGGARASIPEEDDVFINNTYKGSHEKSLHGSIDHLRAPAQSHRLQALSSNEIIQGTPESFVNAARGRKNFAGPVLSVMQHYNFRPTMISPRSKVIWSPGSALSSSAVSNGRNGISTRSMKSTSSQESNELRSPEDQWSNRTNSGSSSKYITGESRSKQSINDSKDDSVRCLYQVINKQEPVQTEHSVDGHVGLDIDHKADNMDVVNIEENGEVDGYEGEGEDERKGEDEREVDEVVDEDFVLGCDCGEYELEDWLVMCDGCVHYFHASCIGMPDSYVELLAQHDPPEWFCNHCTESHKASSDSMTEQSFTSSDHKPISNKADAFEGSLMFTGDDHLPEVVAKPGKRWRKSIAVGLLNKELEQSISLNKSKVDFDKFVLPQLPVNTATHTDRRKTRKSVRLSKMHTHQDMLEEEKDIPTQSHISRLSMKPKRMAARPSFYVVHNPRLSDLSSRDNSLVLQDSRRGTTATRPSFYVTKKPEQTMLEKTILVEEDVSDIDKLLSQCTRSNIIEFSEVYGPDTLVNSKKVGEGAFGEVFLISAADDAAERPVLKVVPIGGDLKVNDEEQTKIMDMMSEVVISRSLSNLRNGSNNITAGFVEVRNCTVFQGSYPDKLLELWDIFDEEKVSENTRPDFLPCDQLYIALEFNNGGQDLEKFVFRNTSQALEAWKQVVHTLAVAETQLEFEHRDLHWGNILIKETSEKTIDYHFDNCFYRCKTSGIQTTIIDFSLSRLTSVTDSCTIYNNLAEDPTLFTAKGDYQFEIYRMMKKENGNDWEKFCPKTNIFWLHYMLDKLINDVYYKGKKNSKSNKSGLAKMRDLKKNLLEYSSAKDWVLAEGNSVE